MKAITLTLILFISILVYSQTQITISSADYEKLMDSLQVLEQRESKLLEQIKRVNDSIAACNNHLNQQQRTLATAENRAKKNLAKLNSNKKSIEDLQIQTKANQNIHDSLVNEKVKWDRDVRALREKQREQDRLLKDCKDFERNEKERINRDVDACLNTRFSLDKEHVKFIETLIDDVQSNFGAQDARIRQLKQELEDWKELNALHSETIQLWTQQDINNRIARLNKISKLNKEKSSFVNSIRERYVLYCETVMLFRSETQKLFGEKVNSEYRFDYLKKEIIENLQKKHPVKDYSEFYKLIQSLRFGDKQNSFDIYSCEVK